MKIAVTASEPQFTAQLDRRFGRCAHFVIVDTESSDWEAFANPAREASGGAGPQAAEFLASKGAERVVSGDFGPNAHQALQAAGIAPYKAPQGQVNDLVEDCLNDQLQPVEAPTTGQRHGGGRRGG
jgi:predicted Fe-Mo cluster-binding NifX family protein